MKFNALAFGLIVAILTTTARAEPAMLRDSVVVSGKFVQLGDLFNVSGDKAKIPVAQAPEPGKRAFFDARWLFRVARAYGLDWRPFSVHDRAVVQRESRVITTEEIEDHILAALMDKGVDPDMHARLSNRTLRLHVAASEEATLAIESISYDESTQRFAVYVWAPANDLLAGRARVTGRLHKMDEVPVLARRILAGEIIKKEDIKWINVRVDRIQSNALLNAEDLIGNTPRRGLRAGVPLRAQQIRRPLLVAKGDMVTIKLKRPGMELSAKGRAIEDGSKGDTIRVTNSQSKIIIETVVLGAHLVTVEAPSRLAMN
jgi:flagella basal body P-ring formation protein FlgA